MHSKSSFALSTVLLIGASAVALAQAGVVVPGAGSSTAPHPDSMQGSNIYSYYMDTDAQGVAGGALLGKISIAGDPPVWDPIPVRVTCLGKVALTTMSDGKLGFRIAGTNVNGALSLEGDSKRQMETHLEGCIVSASLPGFISSTITLTHRNFRDAPDIGTLTLTRVNGAKSSAVSAGSQSIAPKALKLYEKARGEWQAQNPDNIEVELRQAVEIDPGFAEAWYQLGKQERQTRPEQARKDFEKAISIDPQFIRPYEQILVMDTEQAKWKDVFNDAALALKIDPRGTPRIWYAYAEAILKACEDGALPQSKLKVAEASATNALHLDPERSEPGTEQLLALILAEEKNYSAAIEHLRNCLTYATPGADTELVKQQIAKLEKLQSGAAN